MDERLAVLDATVARAADAFLADPLDVGVYARLVQAVMARRAYLNPPFPTPPPALDPLVATPAHVQEVELLDAGVADVLPR